MKVLYFTNIPSPYRIEFFNQLNKEVDLTVLIDRLNDKDRNISWFKDNVLNFNYEIIGNFNPFKVISYLNKKYDVIVIGGYTQLNCIIAIEYMKLKKIQFYINADGGFIANDNFFTKFIKTYFISSATYWLSSGKETNKYLEYYGAKKEKIYIYTFTSLKKEDILVKPIKYSEKRKNRKKYGYDYDRLFISVGQFIHRKGYDLLIETVNKYKIDKCGFVIIGGGSEKKKYEAFLKKYNITNIHFIDFMKKKELFEYLKFSDVFIFPTREDIWGLVVNEAMACGLPVISSNQCLAAQQLLKKENLYDCYNLEKLNKIINKYINYNNKELEVKSMEVIKIISNYVIENMSYKHIKIFENNLCKNEKE